MTAADFYQYNLPFLLFASVLSGMVFGSFLNVVIYRFPIMLKAQWKAHCHELLEHDSEAPAAPPS